MEGPKVETRDSHDHVPKIRERQTVKSAEISDDGDEWSSEVTSSPTKGCRDERGAREREYENELRKRGDARVTERRYADSAVSVIDRAR
jgi:hypothetical protein